MGTGMSDAQYFKVAPNVLCVKAVGIEQILQAEAEYIREY